MIFMIRYGKILLISMFLLLINCNWTVENKQTNKNYKIAKNIYLKSYLNDTLDYTIRCEKAIIDTNEMYMKNTQFEIIDDSSTITILADSAIKSDSFIKYYNNIKIFINDSMELFTDYLFYNQLNDSINTDDSVLIVKENNSLKTKGFRTDKYFKKIVFYNKIIIYGNEN